MSDSTQLLTAERGSEAGAYRPLSAAAVAGFALGVTYAVVVVVLGAVALMTHKPLFLPAWTFLLPVAAVALGWVGRVQVRRSEGTRSGAGLAEWGVRLGLVVGLGYLAFYVGSYMRVVRVEAQGFTRAWLEDIRSGDQTRLYQAFKDIQDPAKRQGDDPSNPAMMKARYGTRGPKTGKSLLQIFEEHNFVRALREGGAECTFECLGVREWDYSQGGYKVGQTYLITAPEGQFEAQIDLLGTEGKEFKGRQWRVVWSDRFEFKPLWLTDMGATLEAWRENVPQFAGLWLRARGDATSAAAYLGTLDPPERHRAVGRLTLAALANLGAGPQGLTPAASAARLLPLSEADAVQDVFLPGRRALAKGGIVVADPKEFEASDDVRDEIIRLVKDNFQNPQVCGISLSSAPYLYVADRDQGRVRAKAEVSFGLRPGASVTAMTPRYTGGGYLTLESAPGPWEPSRPPDWRVVSLRLTHGSRPMTPGEMQDMARGGRRLIHGTPEEVQQQMHDQMQQHMQEEMKFQRQGRP
jgi:hypothetical protein